MKENRLKIINLTLCARSQPNNKQLRLVIIKLQVSIIIAEAAIETIPKTLQNNVVVKNHAKKMKKHVKEILLDINYHYSVMEEAKIESRWKRGRPDIVHVCLLCILSTPLFYNGLVGVYIHTFNNKVILIGEGLRIPKSYKRFEGLMMKLFLEKEILSSNSDRKILLQVKNMTFSELVEKIVKPDKIIGFSTFGKCQDIKTILTENLKKDDAHYVFVIGGFQGGHFSQEVFDTMDKIYSISKYSLEAHVVVSRLIYECEKFLSIQ